MDTNKLIGHLEQLSISEDEFKDSVRIFEDAAIEIDSKRVIECLLKCSQKSETSKILYKMLNENIDSFINGLQIIDDNHAIILINIINIESNEKEKLVGKILNRLKFMLKRSEKDLSKMMFFLSVYFALISNFNCVYPSHLEVMFELLNPFYNEINEEMFKEISSLVLLITLKNRELSKNETADIIKNYLEILYEDDSITTKQFLNLVKILGLLFPILTEVISPIYMNDNCKTHILNQVSKLSNLSLDHPSNRLITIEILKLLSSSCVDEQCRTFNVSTYLELLKFGSKIVSDLEIKLLSTLNIIKLWNFIMLEKDKSSNLKVSMTDLYDNISGYLKYYKSNKNMKYVEYSIEGLAYLTLHVPIKQMIRNDENMIENFLSIFQDKSITEESKVSIHSTLVYGLLLIISNLAKLKDVNEKDHDKNTIKYLKSFSTASAVRSDSSEDQQGINLFNKTLLLDHKVIDVISKLKIYNVSEDSSSNNILNQVIIIIYSVSSNQNKEVRQELVKQGTLNIVLNYLTKNSSINKSSDGETRPLNSSFESIQIRLFAIRSLAKILISVNPSLAFNKYDIKTCLPFLIELLGPDISKYTGTLNANTNDKYLYENITNLDKFESLLALTNLCSIENSIDLKKLVIQKTFDKYLNNFIVDSDLPEIQKASWELISNLIMEPSLLVKFFNIVDNAENFKRLTLLIKLLNSRDESFQIVISSLLANATSEFEMISQILVKDIQTKEDLINIMTDIFMNQANDNELLLRISYILLNLVYAAANLDVKYLDFFRNHQSLKTSLNNVIKSNRNKEILEILIEIIKLVKFK